MPVHHASQSAQTLYYYIILYYIIYLYYITLLRYFATCTVHRAQYATNYVHTYTCWDKAPPPPWIVMRPWTYDCNSKHHGKYACNLKGHSCCHICSTSSNCSVWFQLQPTPYMYIMCILTAASEHFSFGHSSRFTSKGAREPANAKWDT